MENARKLPWDTAAELDRSASLEGLDKVLRAISGAQDMAAAAAPLPPETVERPAERSTAGRPRDFEGTLDLVRQSAAHMKAIRDRIEEVETRARVAIHRAGLELKAAEARTRASEKRAQDMEERARQAEARAKQAEEWLARIHTAIVEQLGPVEATQQNEAQARQA